MISLYGNLIYDKIKYVNSFSKNSSNDSIKQYEAVGAIGNLVQNFERLNNNKINIISNIGNDYYGLKIKQHFQKNNNINLEMLKTTDVHTSNATIIIDKSNTEKTSIVDWGACRQLNDFIPIQSDWSHICYVDTLPYLKPIDVMRIKQVSNFVSIDLCKNKTDKAIVDNILSSLKYIDFMFVSDNEIDNFDFDNDKNHEIICQKINIRYNTNIIFHHAAGSLFFYNNEILKTEIQRLDSKIDVLGAGDSFCSAFIDSVIKQNSYENSIAFSHKHATSIIQNRINNG